MTCPLRVLEIKTFLKSILNLIGNQWKAVKYKHFNRFLLKALQWHFVPTVAVDFLKRVKQELQ